MITALPIKAKVTRKKKANQVQIYHNAAFCAEPRNRLPQNYFFRLRGAAVVPVPPKFRREWKLILKRLNIDRFVKAYFVLLYLSTFIFVNPFSPFAFSVYLSFSLALVLNFFLVLVTIHCIFASLSLATCVHLFLFPSFLSFDLFHSFHSISFFLSISFFSFNLFHSFLSFYLVHSFLSFYLVHSFLSVPLSFYLFHSVFMSSAGCNELTTRKSSRSSRL